MCQLFILVGGGNNELVLASNRDEYFRRSTTRGRINPTTLCYSPIDHECKGTWISVDCSRFRYCVVLNFHDWRLANMSSGSCATRQFTSRGLIPKQFVDGNATANEFAEELRNRKNDFQGFNAIIGDITGAYYFSNCDSSEKITHLQPGHLYGISNGFLDDDSWVKISKGKTKMTAALSTYSISSNEFSRNSMLAGEYRAKCLAEDILENVLLDSCPLTDPTVGHDSATLCRLAAIFVLPTRLEKEVITTCRNLCKAKLENAENATETAVLQAVRSDATDAELQSSKMHKLTSSDSPTDLCKLVSGSRVDGIEVVACRMGFPLELDDYNADLLLSYRDSLFGTRTSTVIIFSHISSPHTQLTQSQESEDSGKVVSLAETGPAEPVPVPEPAAQAVPSEASEILFPFPPTCPRLSQDEPNPSAYLGIAACQVDDLSVDRTSGQAEDSALEAGLQQQKDAAIAKLALSRSQGSLSSAAVERFEGPESSTRNLLVTILERDLDTELGKWSPHLFQIYTQLPA